MTGVDILSQIIHEVSGLPLPDIKQFVGGIKVLADNPGKNLDRDRRLSPRTQEILTIAAMVAREAFDLVVASKAIFENKSKCAH